MPIPVAGFYDQVDSTYNGANYDYDFFEIGQQLGLYDQQGSNYDSAIYDAAEIQSGGYDGDRYDLSYYQDPGGHGYNFALYDEAVYDDFQVRRFFTTSSLKELSLRRVFTTQCLGSNVTVKGITASPLEFSYRYNHGVKVNPATLEPAEIVPGEPLYDEIQGIQVGVFGAPRTICTHLQEFSINEKESGPSEWGLKIQSPWGQHAPENERASEVDQYGRDGLGQFGWKNVLGLRKDMKFSCYQAGTEYNFSGKSSAYDKSRTAPSKLMDFAWKGQDCSQSLFESDIEMDTIRNRTASSCVSEMLRKGGVEYNLTQLYLDDWVIPLMIRGKGRLIDWIMQILSVMGLEWKMVDGKIFTVYLPDIYNGGRVWYYGQDAVVKQVTESVNLQPVFNRIVVRWQREPSGIIKASDITVRLPDPETGVLGPPQVLEQNPDAPGTEVFNFGEYTVGFNPPINDSYYRVIAAEGGVFSDLRYRRGGVIQSVRDPRSGSSIPQSAFGFGSVIPPQGTIVLYPPELLGARVLNCDDCVLVWGEAPQATTQILVDSIGGYGRIEFGGIRPKAQPIPQGPQAGQAEPPPDTELETVVPEYDTELSVTVNDFPSQAFYRKVFTLILDPTTLIGNAGTAYKSGQRKLLKVSRQSCESSWIVPLNLGVQVGHNVQIWDRDLQRDRRLLVTGLGKTVRNSRSGRGTTINCQESFLA